MSFTPLKGLESFPTTFQCRSDRFPSRCILPKHCKCSLVSLAGLLSCALKLAYRRLLLRHRFTATGQRIFSYDVEGTLIAGFDIVQQGNGFAKKAIKREVPVTVEDGFLTIKFMEQDPRVSDPKVSGIEVKLTGPHYAHAVAGGPYFAVDVDNNNEQAVAVDGGGSHTHGPGQVLASFTWRKGATIVGTGEVASLNLPVGEHAITLTVVDSSGDTNTDTTTITVYAAGYPALTSLSPNTGSIAGGTEILIAGFAFGAATKVQFGLATLAGTDIVVINDSTIRVKTPASGVAIPVAVSVVTPSGESNPLLFSYVGTVPIGFTTKALISNFTSPSAIAFGPDSKLYVGNTKGELGKFTLNDKFDGVVSSVVKTIATSSRGIHGIAFDPAEHADISNPTVYISTSDIYHGESRNTFGQAINGKIQAVRGANLDQVTDLVTGMPVSETDHAVSKILALEYELAAPIVCDAVSLQNLVFLTRHRSTEFTLVRTRFKLHSGARLIIFNAHTIHVSRLSRRRWRSLHLRWEQYQRWRPRRNIPIQNAKRKLLVSFHSCRQPGPTSIQWHRHLQRNDRWRSCNRVWSKRSGNFCFWLAKSVRHSKAQQRIFVCNRQRTQPRFWGHANGL
jgi:IPT/TIG domain/Malectin domain